MTAPPQTTTTISPLATGNRSLALGTANDGVDTNPSTSPEAARDVTCVVREMSSPPSPPRHTFQGSIKPFAGIIHDIKSRAPYYMSDWTDAYNYR